MNSSLFNDMSIPADDDFTPVSTSLKILPNADVKRSLGPSATPIMQRSGDMEVRVTAFYT
jgi:hypothetical protein